MTKLKTVLLSARQLKLTPLQKITRNATHWSSTYEMAARYSRTRDFLPKLSVQKVDELCQSSSKNRRTDR